MVYENFELWRILVGVLLLFTVPSCCYFWKFIIDYERKEKKMIIYKFFYYDKKNNELMKICRTEREAEVFFDILVSARYRFKVYTLYKKNNS